MPKFRCTVQAYGTFDIEAKDMYEADRIATQEYSFGDIMTAVEAGSGWSIEGVNDGEYPEEV